MKVAWLVLDLDHQWDLLEEYAGLTEEEQLPWLIKKHKEKQIEILGMTDKSAPELATELIKLGVRAKSIVPKKKDA